MFTIRHAAALAATIVALMGSAFASVPPAASTVNIDALTVMPRETLAARFPDLSAQEVDKLLFRIADARSMALLLGKAS